MGRFGEKEFVLNKLMGLFCLITAASMQLKAGNMEEITKITAYVIHGATEGVSLDTPKDIDCKTFSQRTDLDTFDVTGYKKEVMKIASYPFKKTNWESVDTRAQLEVIYKSGSVDVICLSYLPAIMMNGVVYIDTGVERGNNANCSPYDTLVQVLKKINNKY